MEFIYNLFILKNVVFMHELEQTLQIIMINNNLYIMFLNTAKLHYCQYYYQNYIHLDEDVIHAHSSFCIAIIHVSIIVVLVMLKAIDTFLTWIIIFVAVILQLF